ncbi:MAG: hypothetical protein ABJE95_27840 [Byssovorax sp.]
MTTTSNARGAARSLNGEAQTAAPKVGLPDLSRRFTDLTNLLYDTAIPVAVLQEKVYPYLAPDIQFRDPWVKTSGLRHFWTGLQGFHAVIRFDFRILQLAVQMNERGDGGRVLVDGVMNLNQLVIYTYPLRTMLVYEFTMLPDGQRLQITSLEEMWSFGDLIENTPGMKRPYEKYRRFFGNLFGGMFWVAAKAVELRTSAAASKTPAAA